MEIFGHGYKGKKYVHDGDIAVCYFCGKVGPMASKCKDLPKKGASNVFNTNKKEPKKIWVPMDKLIHVVDVLGSRKETPVMVPRQWQLAAHDKRKLYVSMLDPLCMVEL